MVMCLQKWPHIHHRTLVVGLTFGMSISSFSTISLLRMLLLSLIVTIILSRASPSLHLAIDRDHGLVWKQIKFT